MLFDKDDRPSDNKIAEPNKRIKNPTMNGEPQLRFINSLTEVVMMFKRFWNMV